MNQHRSLCDRVMNAMCQFVDGELSAEANEVVNAHLDACPPCKAHADLERTVKDSVKRCCPTAAAPDRLREQVIQRIASSRVEWVTGVVVTQTFTIEIREN